MKMYLHRRRRRRHRRRRRRHRHRRETKTKLRQADENLECTDIGKKLLSLAPEGKSHIKDCLIPYLYLP